MIPQDGLTVRFFSPKKAGLGGCTCYFEPPSIPVYRSPETHLDHCPAKGSGFPVGVFHIPEPAAPIVGTPELRRTIDTLRSVPGSRRETFEERLRRRIEARGVDAVASYFRLIAEDLETLMTVAGQAENISPAEFEPVLAAHERTQRSLAELRAHMSQPTRI